ncbi:hypothetical protein BJV82DRAFT_713938 [Fennellomyces sp. T-0311]|nr:hypothetical protein BJV82DRAFT_713938 [Fennellomyces sp. T-0311]
MNTKFWLSLVTCIPLAALSIYYFAHLPAAPNFDLVCQTYGLPVHTGLTTFDSSLCTIVLIFSHAMGDTLGYNFAWMLLGYWGLLMAVFAIEGSRTRSNVFLAMFSFWGLISNFLGMSNVMFLFWIPAFYYCFNSTATKDVRNFTVPTARVNAILLAILAGYAAPTAAMLLMDQTSSLFMIVIIVWQFGPLWVGPLYEVLTSVLGCCDDPEDTRMTDEAREKIKIADSRNAVERLYMVLGLCNTAIYYSMYIRLKMYDILSVETFVDLFTLRGAELTVTTLEMARFVGTHVFAMDLVICYIACGVWALFEDGLKGALIMLAATVVLGPGGGFAMYVVYRENRVQDTTRLAKKNQ